MATQCPYNLSETARKIIAKTKASGGKEFYAETDQAFIHSHPNGVEQLSDVDIETHRKHNKPIACIALVPQKQVVCYNITKNKVEPTCKWQL